MKLETVGWWVFLVSLFVFAMSFIYAVGKFLVVTVWSLLIAYNHNIEWVMLTSAAVAIVGVIVIKLGASRADGQH